MGTEPWHLLLIFSITVIVVVRSAPVTPRGYGSGAWTIDQFAHEVIMRISNLEKDVETLKAGGGAKVVASGGGGQIDAKLAEKLGTISF